MKYYWSNDGEMIISEDDLHKGYEDLKAEGYVEEETYEDYLIDCTTGNGDLTPIRDDELFLDEDGNLTCEQALRRSYEDDRCEYECNHDDDFMSFKEWAESKNLVRADWN